MFRCLRRLGLNLMIVCLGPALTIAQPKGPGLPQPGPELSQLGFFVGTFECKGDAFQTTMSQPHPVERTILGKMDLDGFWLFMRFEDKDTEVNPMPIRGNWQLGYNAKDKNFQAIWTDNLGRWFPQTSAGWVGDTIAFTGEFSLDNQKAAVRDSFTKKSEREMTMTVDIQRGGEWMRFLEFGCDKH